MLSTTEGIKIVIDLLSSSIVVDGLDFLDASLRLSLVGECLSSVVDGGIRHHLMKETLIYY
jgi:hypothetical protein